MTPSRMGSSKILAALPEMKTDKMTTTKAAIQVFDVNGVDVTPRPLYRPDPHTGTPKPNKLLTSREGSFSSEFVPSHSLYQNTLNPSMLGQFSRSVLGSSTVSKSSLSTNESIAEDLEELSYKREGPASITELQIPKKTTRKTITKEELKKTIDILLTETETITLFNLPTVMISVEAEEADKILQRNKNYENLCKNRLGNDLYVERMMQTINGAPKNKDVQCDRIIKENKGIMSTAWDLYDSYNTLELASLPIKQSTIDSSCRGSIKRSIIESSSKVSVLSKDQDRRGPGSTTEKNSDASSIMEIENAILAKMHDEEEDHSEAIFKSEKFHQDLFFMERVLMENVFQPKLAAYRQLPILKEPKPEGPKDLSGGKKREEVEEKKEEEEEIEIGEEQSTIPANLERLWSFSCDLTKGLNVSSLAWNKTNPWPERIYQSPYGVTAVDFSIGTPNLLAVGYHNGTIAIYNVQSNVNVPVLDSSESPQKHLEPIWQLQWIEQDRGTTGDDKREILVSISADGRIAKWVIRKGLDCYDLMRLKRTTASISRRGGEKEKKGEALISRQAPGMCFAFHPKDTNIYLAGTEEGHIHKCSCSYNEQYLDTYRGHKLWKLLVAEQRWPVQPKSSLALATIQLSDTGYITPLCTRVSSSIK
ncbi:WD repeat-containing protein 78 [Myotis brandtii]|uniref:Dynein axonemal intermediate chain 4 n=1 Tax=Myotis brandtii TaxID=109478 RepID=S7PEL2_MYOBR|nr:WD repeat-containing protein 78 [Myotis brandtii]